LQKERRENILNRKNRPHTKAHKMAKSQKYTEQHHWNAIFSVAFLVIASLIFILLQDDYALNKILRSIGALDIAIMSLAVFRLIRLFSFDKIFEFVRLWFLDAKEKDGGVSYEKPPRGPRRTAADLLECIWCTGIWSALIVSALYFSGVFGQFVVLILAIAALGSFFQNVSIKIAK